jgi:dihydrofolate synthase/folylpolyglutamate synthase
MIAASLTAAGHTVGLHTSPHLFSLAERMRVNGRAASNEWIASTTSKLSPLITEARASFFEATTAMSLHFFAESSIDVAVVEVGMGGRLDATNVVSPAVTVITNVGLDHTQHLGSTLAEIAGEKAGIIKPDVPVVSGCDQDAVRRVIRVVAEQRHARLIEVVAEADAEADGSDLNIDEKTMDLGGAHQKDNAALAARSLEVLLEQVPHLSADLYKGLACTRHFSGLRGRSDVLHDAPTVVADVAHNKDGIRAILTFMSDRQPAGGRLSVVLGVPVDRDAVDMLEVLAEFSVEVIPARVDSPKLAAPDEISAVAKQMGLRILEIASPAEAVHQFLETSMPDDSLLVSGSHFVVAALPEPLFRQGHTKC